MLTSDLVRARRRGDSLHIVRMSAAQRARALELARRYVAAVELSVGRTRGELEEAWAAAPVEVRDRKLAAGLRKLVLDRCELEVAGGCEPAALRRAVFVRAAQARRELAPGQPLDREAVLASAAAELAAAGEPGMDGDGAAGDTGAGANDGAGQRTPDGAGAGAGAAGAEALERRLYADLRGEHRLLGWKALSPEALLERYELGQAQAVLLRAVELVAEVRSASPGAYRALFHKLKFLRLLYRLEARPGGAYRITIDGPFSMFRAVTRYGLELALLLPALQACEQWSVRAQVVWGKRRERLWFAIGRQGSPEVSPRGARQGSRQGAREPSPGDVRGDGDSNTEGDGGGEAARLPDEVAGLLDRFRARDSAWEAAPTSDILDLPGVGLCVPDLVFIHRETGECAYLEVMGFWSRDAVWRRVELVEAGLPQKILFAVSSRLRVSEEVLPEGLPGALYVYKGVMSAKAVADRLDQLVARTGSTA